MYRLTNFIEKENGALRQIFISNFSNIYWQKYPKFENLIFNENDKEYIERIDSENHKNEAILSYKIAEIYENIRDEDINYILLYFKEIETFKKALKFIFIHTEMGRELYSILRESEKGFIYLKLQKLEAEFLNNKNKLNRELSKMYEDWNTQYIPAPEFD